MSQPNPEMEPEEVEIIIPEFQEVRQNPPIPDPAEIRERLALPAGRHHREEASSAESDKPRRGPGRPPKSESKPTAANLKIRPPDFSEWHDYLGNFAIRWVTRGYVAYAFRGIDRWSILSDSDNQALEMDAEQLSDIAKPIAHLADRSKFGKRYGRVIIDSSDGVAAAIQIGMWASRVNRIANKYRNGITNELSDGSVGEGVSGEETEASVIRPEFGGQRATGFGYN